MAVASPNGLGADSAHAAPEAYGASRIRAIGGGPLAGARLFRSCDLSSIDAQEADVIVRLLGVRSIYDIPQPERGGRAT